MRRKPFSPKLALATSHASAGGRAGNGALRGLSNRSRFRPSVLFRSADSSTHESADSHTESVVTMRAPEVAASDPHHDPGMAAAAPAHPHLPSPTYWPAFLAFGITLLAWSLITSWVLAVVGILVIFVAIGGWIGDLLNEH